MSATITPFSPTARAKRRERQVAIRATINARAAYLGIPDSRRRHWEAIGLQYFAEGSSAAWSIAEALRGMMDEYRKTQSAGI